MRKKRKQLLHSAYLFAGHLLLPALPIAFIVTQLMGCGTAAKSPSGFSENSSQEASGDETDPSKLIEKLNLRIESLENRLTSLNEKLDSTRLSVDQLSIQQKLKQAEVLQHPVDRSGALTSVEDGTPHSQDSIHGTFDEGYMNDAAVQAFRRGWITFASKKYPEAILSFSDFVEKFPDHLLAGSAQYYMAKSYLLQKEYKLATQEYQKLLSSYELDAHVTDTLRDLITAQEALKEMDAVSRYRQILTSSFPQSPATWSLAQYSEKSIHQKIQPPAAHPTEPTASHSKENSSTETAPPPLAPPTAPLIQGEAKPTQPIEAKSNSEPSPESDSNSGETQITTF